MGIYLSRALRYLLKLLVIVVAVFYLLKLTGWATPGNFSEVMHTWRGPLIAGLLLLFCALYPVYGYMTRSVRADLAADGEKIVRAMDMGGYVLTNQSEGEMRFRSRNMLKRIVEVGEDAVTFTRQGDHVLINGLRKEVDKANYRLRSMFE